MNFTWIRQTNNSRNRCCCCRPSSAKKDFHLAWFSQDNMCTCSTFLLVALKIIWLHSKCEKLAKKLGMTPAQAILAIFAVHCHFVTRSFGRSLFTFVTAAVWRLHFKYKLDGVFLNCGITYTELLTSGDICTRFIGACVTSVTNKNCAIFSLMQEDEGSIYLLQFPCSIIHTLLKSYRRPINRWLTSSNKMSSL